MFILKVFQPVSRYQEVVISIFALDRDFGILTL